MSRCHPETNRVKGMAKRPILTNGTIVRASLADVQPGGRVRLEDHRSDLVPGIVRCAKCQFQLVRSNLNMHDGTVTAGDSKTEPCPNGCGPLWPVTWETWAREGWAEAERLHLENAALSAQPSPGGQGDALLESLVARWRNHAEEIGVSDNLLCQKIANCTMRHAAELQAALAARQPVGEPVAWYYGFSDTGEAGPVTFGGNPGAEAIAWAERHGHTLHYLYAAPPAKQPAKAVDLGAVREAVRKAWQKCAAGESVDLQFGTLLALIDGQAVGNG